MVMITLYAKQKKRHRCIKQTFGLLGEGEDGMIERIALKHVYYHCEIDNQSRFDA